MCAIPANLGISRGLDAGGPPPGGPFPSPARSSTRLPSTSPSTPSPEGRARLPLAERWPSARRGCSAPGYWDRAVAAAGLDGLTPHGLRHTAISL
ncbi:MAG: hypothetical protein E6G06_22330 [Actinobacteria bacterium]|nr:MAG: hypothetical protein E6G06_22330 [Actinomycetota bacterium]